MKVAVLGAGAIGAYVGACLDRGGIDVTLIARGAHLAAMQERGVRVLSPRGDFTAHPRATDDWGAAGEADVVFVGLKARRLIEMITVNPAAALGLDGYGLRDGGPADLVVRRLAAEQAQ